MAKWLWSWMKCKYIIIVSCNAMYETILNDSYYLQEICTCQVVDLHSSNSLKTCIDGVKVKVN